MTPITTTRTGESDKEKGMIDHVRPDLSKQLLLLLPPLQPVVVVVSTTTTMNMTLWMTTMMIVMMIAIGLTSRHTDGWSIGLDQILMVGPICLLP
jgi:hypothetical protein